MKKKMDNNAIWTEVGALATLLICVMTFITFMITAGVWEEKFWKSELEGASILGYDGYWGEDIVVTYADGVTESVKGISNSMWSTMEIQNEGSKPIFSLQYCINALIPTSDMFNTQEYRCAVSVIQNNNIFYQTVYTTTGSVNIEADEWTRVITVPLNIQSISSNWDDGTYHVLFENAGTIEGIGVPNGLSLDIAVTEDIITFLI